jgi:hypothetical protein
MKTTRESYDKTNRTAKKSKIRQVKVALYSRVSKE